MGKFLRMVMDVRPKGLAAIFLAVGILTGGAISIANASNGGTAISSVTFTTVVVTNSQTFLTPGTQTVIAECPAGTVATGGGGGVAGNEFQTHFRSTAPVGTAPPTG